MMMKMLNSKKFSLIMQVCFNMYRPVSSIGIFWLCCILCLFRLLYTFCLCIFSLLFHVFSAFLGRVGVVVAKELAVLELATWNHFQERLLPVARVQPLDHDLIHLQNGPQSAMSFFFVL